jgi:F-type H+-transporting ATPase subunit epsilon
MIHLDILAPEGFVFSQEVDMAVIPGEEGYLGILPNHSPLGLTLKPGIIDIYQGTKKEHRYYIEGGYAHIHDNKAVVLATNTEDMKTLDVKALEERTKNLHNEVSSSEEKAHFQDILDVIAFEMKS